MISTKARHTKHYIVRENGADVAFLSLDLVPDADCLVLYEIFVPTNLRRQGIGSRLLLEVESFATRHGYENVVLSPSPLEAEQSKAELIGWYKSRGYKKRTQCSTELEKRVGWAHR